MSAQLVVGHVILSAGASEHVPVVIAGAGPTGLTLSILLGQLGIPNLVLDRAPALPNHPQVRLTSTCLKGLQGMQQCETELTSDEPISLELLVVSESLQLGALLVLLLFRARAPLHARS